MTSQLLIQTSCTPPFELRIGLFVGSVAQPRRTIGTIQQTDRMTAFTDLYLRNPVPSTVAAHTCACLTARCSEAGSFDVRSRFLYATHMRYPVVAVVSTTHSGTPLDIVIVQGRVHIGIAFDTKPSNLCSKPTSTLHDMLASEESTMSSCGCSSRFPKSGYLSG